MELKEAEVQKSQNIIRDDVTNDRLTFDEN